MTRVDSGLPPLENEDGEYLKIHKKDIRPLYDLNHEHQYKPDGSEDTDEWYSVSCVVEGCNQGRLIRKDDLSSGKTQSRDRL